MNLTLYFACLSSLAEKRTWRVQAMKYTPVKFVLAVCMAFGLIAGVKYLNTNRTAWKNWNSAYRLYTMSNYAACLPQYEKAWPVLKTDGDYLTNYGKAVATAQELIHKEVKIKSTAIDEIRKEMEKILKKYQD